MRMKNVVFRLAQYMEEKKVRKEHKCGKIGIFFNLRRNLGDYRKVEDILENFEIMGQSPLSQKREKCKSQSFKNREFRNGDVCWWMAWVWHLKTVPARKTRTNVWKEPGAAPEIK